MNTWIYKTLLFWSYFIGVGGLLGTAMMCIDPSGKMWGMEILLPILREKLPLFYYLFNNFIASSVVLFIVISMPNMISLYLLHKKSPYGTTSVLICGLLLMNFMLLEFYIWGTATLSLIYFIFGFIQSVSAWWLINIKFKCEKK